MMAETVSEEERRYHKSVLETLGLGIVFRPEVVICSRWPAQICRNARLLIGSPWVEDVYGTKTRKAHRRSSEAMDNDKLIWRNIYIYICNINIY